MIYFISQVVLMMIRKPNEAYRLSADTTTQLSVAFFEEKPLFVILTRRVDKFTILKVRKVTFQTDHEHTTTGRSGMDQSVGKRDGNNPQIMAG